MPVVDCPHADRCAGCPLIDLELDEQLVRKRSLVTRALKRFPTLQPLHPQDVRPAPSHRAYRTRAKLVVAPGPRLGLYARLGDHEVVDLPHCQVLAPALYRVAAVIRALMADPAKAAPSVLRPLGSPGGRLRAVDLREVLELDGTRAVLVTLVLAAAETAGPDVERSRSRSRGGRGAQRTASGGAAAVDERVAHGRVTDGRGADGRGADGRVTDELVAAANSIQAGAPEVRVVAASWHRGASPQVLGSRPEVIVGPESVRDRLPGGAASGSVAVGRTPRAHPLFVYAAPGSFAQVHREQAGAIYRRAAQWLGARLGGLAGAPIVEAYSGTGSFGLVLAAEGARLISVESFEPAARAARRAAQELGLEVRALSGDACEQLERLRAEGVHPAAIVLNPPRSGLPARVRAACAALHPQALAYLSCDPETLARDLADLSRLGLTTTALEPFDMIPLTEQVETLALLQAGTPARPQRLHDANGLLVVDKPGHEPTGEPLSPSGSLLARLRAHDPRADFRPVLSLDAAASGLCLLAAGADAARAWTARLHEAPTVQQYVVLCRGITPAKGVVRPRRRAGHSGPGPTGQGRPAPLAPAGQQVRTILAPGPSSHAAEATSYRRLAVVGGHSLLTVRTKLAGANILLRHLAAIGHPVLGDLRWGHEPSNRHMAQAKGLDRPFLHRGIVRLGGSAHPPPGEWRAPLPGDLALVLDRLGGPDAARWRELLD